MNIPILINEISFQIAWAKAVKILSDNSWNMWNIIVQINNPELFDKGSDDLLTSFAKKNNIIIPKHVAHTIFPQSFYSNGITKENLYKKYWRFFDRPREKPRNGWGTYFQRMIKYPIHNVSIDQLGTIIDSINNRERNYGASYFIIIPCPDKDLNIIMGAPCLNYITVQVENVSENKTINLLAVYRNHDFLRKVYGNYYGLCNLLKYIAHETNSKIGTLTCISSHAYVDDFKNELLHISETILERKV